MEEGAEGREEGQARANNARLIAAAPFLIVATVGLWLTRSFWMPGSYVVGFDTYAYSGPNLEVTERAIRHWRLPIVNDLIFGGVPHLGNPSAAALYPPNLLTLVLGTNRAMGVIVAAHVVLLGVGMVLLARRLDLSRLGATAAGVIVMSAGATLTKTIQYEQILVLAWMPMLLVSIHAVLTSTRPWRAMAAMSATTALILLAGHPQLVYESVVLAVAATIGFAIDEQRWRRLPHLAGGAALGACIALPQLVAVLFATADSAIKGGRSIDDLLLPALSLTPNTAVRALLGTIQDRDPAVFAGSFESIGFVGVVVALLAVVGMIQAISSRSSRSWAISLGAAAALALVWAIGPRTVIFRVAFEVIPGFDLARATARWIVIVVVVAALFAGVGVDVARRGVARRHLAGAAVATAVVVLAVALGLVTTADNPSALIWAGTAAVVLVVLAVGMVKHDLSGIAVIAVVVLAAAELSMMSLHSLPQAISTDVPFDSHRSETTDFLVAHPDGSVVALTDDGRTVDYQVPGLRPNANVLFRIRSIDGYDGGVQITERWADSLRRFTPEPDTELPLRNSLSIPIEPGPLGRMGVRYILLDRNRPADVFIPGWTGPQATDANFEVWENPSWRSDAVIWSSAVASDDPAELLRESPATVSTSAIVTSADDAFECDTARSDCEPVGVAVTRPRPERIDVDVDVDHPTLVSVTQQALPGWTVAVDGVAADVVDVDGLFLGVKVPAGQHSVTFTYRSPWLGVSLGIALLALAATIALAIVGTVQQRRDRTTQVAGDGDR
jgi:Bacterial membrane protein YfhO